jgi:gliding motility-associated-like protein
VNGYRYQWESTTNSQSWDSLQYSAGIRDYQAQVQTVERSFRRIVFSGLKDCCKSISNEIKVSIEPEIKNNLIVGDTTLCNGAVPAIINGTNTFSGGTGTGYSFSWIRKNAKTRWQEIPGEKEFSLQPGALSDTSFYIRVVTSGTCIDSSNVVKINVLNTIAGNQIAGDSAVCEGYSAGPLGSGELSGGEPGKYRFRWESSPDRHRWEPVEGQSSPKLIPGILENDTYFRRIVQSGPNDCCQSVSNIFRITWDKKPGIADAEADKEILYQDVASLVAVKPETGAGQWTTPSEAEIEEPENHSTSVSGLKFGRYVFYWTVTNGVCPASSDSVVVTVNDLQRYTGFSPNGDGINDVFIIEGLDHAPQKDLSIMNRWGVEVFHSPDYQNDWDGKNKNGDDLPEDTYYYILKVKDIYNQGKQKIYKGYFVIRR